jgi:hypothetical protein
MLIFFSRFNFSIIPLSKNVQVSCINIILSCIDSISDDEPILSAAKKDVATPIKSSGLLKEFLPLSLEGQFVHEVLDQVCFHVRCNKIMSQC